MDGHYVWIYIELCNEDKEKQGEVYLKYEDIVSICATSEHYIVIQVKNNMYYLRLLLEDDEKAQDIAKKIENGYGFGPIYATKFDIHQSSHLEFDYERS